MGACVRTGLQCELPIDYVAHVFANRHPFGVLLDDFNYMSDPTGDGVFADHANGRHVYARLTGEEHPGCRKVDHIGQI